MSGGGGRATTRHGYVGRRDGAAWRRPPSATARRSRPPGTHRSRTITHWSAPAGGLSTKLHLACEHGHKPMSPALSAGQAGDAPHFEAVTAGIRIARPDGGRPRTRPHRIRADKAYYSRAIRAHLRQRRIACTIPQPASRARAR
ncbi:transposase [Actinacidiphila glaucinigra]|uniref:transposase n=1 Tax=Actinacidiphila glaucinigra TaxID=235986 RepID=UPI00366C6B8F